MLRNTPPPTHTRPKMWDEWFPICSLAITEVVLVSILLYIIKLRNSSLQEITDIISFSGIRSPNSTRTTHNEGDDSHLQNGEERHMTSPLLGSVDEERGGIDSAIIFPHHGFYLLEYSTSLNAVMREHETSYISNHQLIIGPNTRLEEYRMVQVDEDFIDQFPAYEDWGSQNRCRMIMLNLGLVNMYHFTRMRNFQCSSPTDLEFFRFHSSFSMFVFFVRWGGFWIIILSLSSSDDDHEIKFKNYPFGFFLSFVLIYFRMNTILAEIIENILSRSQLVVESASFLSVCDLTLNLLVVWRIFTQSFPNTLFKICCFIYLIGVDRILLDMLGPLLFCYQYQCKVKILNTFRTTMFYNHSLHTIFVIICFLLIVIIFLFMSHLARKFNEFKDSSMY
jgi:hypothetical protein